MASTAIIGLPGGGKSYYAVERLVEILRTDKRNVVTNIPLNLDALSEYFVRHHDDYTVLDRITLLDPLDFEKAKNFFLYRGGDLVLPGFPEDFESYRDPNTGDIDPDGILSNFGPGVVYFLDEVHQFLNARNWKAVGSSILRYLSMHRHLGDDIYWITQAPGNVDKQWRSLTQSYFSCRNYKYEKFRGLSKGGKMEVRETLNIPGPHNSEVAQSVHTRTLDLEIAALYHTSVIQGGADTSKRPAGIHYRWIIVLIFLVLIGGSIGIWWGSKKVVGKVFPGFSGEKRNSSSSQVFAPARDTTPSSEQPLQFPDNFPSVSPDYVVRPDPYAPTGYSKSVLKDNISVKSETLEAARYAAPPIEQGDLVWSGNLSYFGAPAVYLGGQLYTKGRVLPDGNVLLEVDPPVAQSPRGVRVYYHKSSRPVANDAYDIDLSPDSDPLPLPSVDGPGLPKSFLNLPRVDFSKSTTNQTN